mmetsp:Transcript_16126/g.23744  ORF Transcript_16126/g.23744 Transcript_16126/m.23744 type:complete len:269 (-) Transcript_16126:137-943(-)|eukprot:CAMPEP_0116029106 /NCGR_PEP_ID=MMETSP0321-20121206/15906_1 /TAXON_ID=163516 /ORGANISM="Leptocylindrus danicus var. danicus, Strain B650" /LENGTH=268 /DNA_ID=CAMNT_0003503347 /DNA_START=91 /DNA_END=897 /DNA_ORIENTATION=-
MAADEDRDDDNDDEEPKSNSDELEDTPEETQRVKAVKFWTRTTMGLGLVNAGVTVAAAGGMSVALAVPVGSTVGTCAMGPVANSNEQELSDVAAMQEVKERMEREINRMREANKELRAKVEKLKGSVEGMEDTQNTLDTITKQQTSSIADFEEQVERQKALLAELQEDARSGMLQNLLTVIIAGDQDGDFKIDEEEIDGIIEGIEASGDLGVNAELFRKKVIETNGEIQAVLDMCAMIMKEGDGVEEIPEDEKIFFVKTEDDKKKKKT